MLLTPQNYHNVGLLSPEKINQTKSFTNNTKEILKFKNQKQVLLKPNQTVQLKSYQLSSGWLAWKII